MGRPTNKPGATVAYGRGCEFSDEDKTTLIELTGMKNDSQREIMILKVGVIVQIILSESFPTNNLPRSVDYVNSYKNISKKADVLLKVISNQNEFILDDFIFEDVDINKTKKVISNLITKSNNLLNKWDGFESSKGRPRDTTLHMAIKTIRTLFRKYYKGESTDRKKRGMITSLSCEERKERCFIKVALKKRTQNLRYKPTFQ